VTTAHPVQRSIRFGILPVMVATMLCSAISAPAGGILTGTITQEQLRSVLVPYSQWQMIPPYADREQWGALPPAVRAAYVTAGERLLRCSWPELNATGFLEYVRTGDRNRFQTTMFSRRQQLAALVIAECVEGKGRFRDDIINGIWAICEESYWGVPAHVGAQRAGSGLPDVEEPTVDLFAAETSSLLAWTSYLLRDSLDAVSPLISRRIVHETADRIITPNLARNDFWWMGLTPKKVNNWTPWICSNWLATVLVLEKDPDIRVRSVYKILQCLDRFLDTYEDDGGCDEGPSYWGRAGGALFDCLELLHSATGGRVDVYAHPRIKAIGTYIARAHIAGPWFVNFADAAARLQTDAPTIFRYGKAIGDQTMIAFGAKTAHDQHLGEGILPGQFGVLGRVLPGLFVLTELLRAAPADACERDVWFPGIQVMTARAVGGSTEGFFVAAQGGHNDESHNHNDVGNFITYLDGEPLIIDVGVETYTAKTFSGQRYTIWTMQSAYHNVPLVNGVMQKNGREFAAQKVEYTARDDSASLAMDIGGAYPPEAGVRSWKRTVTLNRQMGVEVRDVYDLRDAREPVRLTLMTCREPDVTSSGFILLPPVRAPGTGRGAAIRYEEALFTVRAEPIAITDPQLQGSWGERIWRIILTAKSPAVHGASSIMITAGK
jgi:hypothetical protein